MLVKIDNINRTCSINRNGTIHHSMIADAIITTGADERRPMLCMEDAKAYITDAQVISLINAGALDVRGSGDASVEKGP